MDFLETRIYDTALEIVLICPRGISLAIQIIQSVIFTCRRKNKFNQ